MDGGWSSHIPLTYLTDKGCLFKDKSSIVSAQDLLTVDPSSGAIQTTSTSLSDEGELDLIKTYLPDEFLMWGTHYLFILNSEN